MYPVLLHHHPSSPKIGDNFKSMCASLAVEARKLPVSYEMEAKSPSDQKWKAQVESAEKQGARLAHRFSKRALVVPSGPTHNTCRTKDMDQQPQDWGLSKAKDLLEFEEGGPCFGVIPSPPPVTAFIFLAHRV